MPEAWSIGGTFSYIGLGALTGTKPAAPVLPEDEMRARFSEQYEDSSLRDRAY